MAVNPHKKSNPRKTHDYQVYAMMEGQNRYLGLIRGYSKSEVEHKVSKKFDIPPSWISVIY